MDKVSEYIKNNWKYSIQPAENLSGEIKINKPFISPCITGMFTDMYYWDTYFINKGLLIDGLTEQALNNIDNIATFIIKHGWMPNSNGLLDRSQPPFFCRMVYEYYKFTNDKSVIETYMPVMLKEYNFFQTQRMTPIGLNAYSTNGSKEDIIGHYNWLNGRVQESSDDPDRQLVIGKDIVAIAESGMDFNMRFRVGDYKLCAHEFAHLDLNCILYDYEKRLADMLRVLDRNKEAEDFDKYAEKRKQLINKYMFDKERGIYSDYNFVRGTYSQIISAVSLYPFTFDISTDKNSALEVFKRIELQHGISACEYRGDDIYYQWDYPCMWPYTTYFVSLAMKKIGLEEESKRAAKYYVDAVASVFEKTGKIWEKYDARTGDVGYSTEYETPEMLGWSAAIYRVFVENQYWY